MRPRVEANQAGAVSGGVILITLGLLFLSGELGIANIVDWWRYWPAILIAVAVSTLVAGGEDRWGGLTNLLLGLTFLAINFNWYGLSWGSGWPLIIVAIGAGMTLKALLTPRRTRRDPSDASVVEENRHG